MKPNLLKQETQSLACALRILFRMYADDQRQAHIAPVQDLLIRYLNSGCFCFCLTRSHFANSDLSWGCYWIFFQLAGKILPKAKGRELCFASFEEKIPIIFADTS